MNKVITVPTSYKVTLKNGDFTTFRNENNYDDYEDRLISGTYAVTTSLRSTPINADTVLRIEVYIYPNGCEHCKHGYDLHAGENVCPKCGGRTFLPVVEK